ncbi:hypothetical protein GQ457_10G011290 [Hibiscus cannabinus]
MREELAPRSKVGEASKFQVEEVSTRKEFPVGDSVLDFVVEEPMQGASSFEKKEYFLSLRIPVAIWRTDTQGEYRYPKGRTDTRRSSTCTLSAKKPTTSNGNLQYRYARTRTDTLCTKSTDLADESIPTATNSFGTIKDTSKHQGKANASLINIHMMKICLCT